MVQAGALQAEGGGPAVFPPPVATMTTRSCWRKQGEPRGSPHSHGLSTCQEAQRVPGTTAVPAPQKLPVLDRSSWPLPALPPGPQKPGGKL